MFKYNCLNPIASVGLDLFSGDYEKVEDLGQADAALVRSAAMHELELPDSLLAVARAGAVSTTFLLTNVQKKESLYSILRGQMQTV